MLLSGGRGGPRTGAGVPLEMRSEQVAFPTLFAVNKPRGMTSYAVVDLVKRCGRSDPVGHGGALDPLATGVLVIGIGREATKQLGRLQRESTKVYQAVIRLGITSPTDDAEGPLNPNENATPVSREAVEKALAQFIGVHQQAPPSFSAVKVKGQRAYEVARRKGPLNLAPRPTVVHSIELLKYEWPDLEVKVTTGAGVYLRAIARDLGVKLETGGVLWSLNRLAVGSFQLEQALSLEEMQKLWQGPQDHATDR